MNIAVLIKQVPKDTCVSLNSDNTINRSSAAGVINPIDLNALEEVLRLKDKYNCKITAITMGNNNAKSILKKALALGVDEAVLVTDKAFIGSDTYATSFVIFRVLEYLGGIDIIVCGKQTVDGATAQVPAELAGLLNINYATNVMKCYLEDEYLHCECKLENGIRIDKLNLPAIVSISKIANIPRLPSVDGILKSESKDIKIITNNELKIENNLCGLKGSLTKVVECIPIKNEGNRKKMCICFDEFYTVYSKLIEKIKMESFDNTSMHSESHDMMKVNKKTVMVFCEFMDNNILTESIEALNQACELAIKLNTNVSVITIEAYKEISLSVLPKYGVIRNYILNVKNMQMISERRLAEEVVKAVEKEKPQILLFSGTILGRGIAPYVAARLQSGLTADCTELDIQEESGQLIQTRPAFGGKLYAVILSQNCNIQMATIKPNIFKKRYHLHGIKTELVENFSKCSVEEESQFERDEDGNVNFEQKVIIGIGKGIESKKNCEIVQEYCKKRGFGFCATREIVDKGWIDHKYQVGLTGTIIVPKLYIALGISGANEHLVGIQRSEIIVAVNLKANEPIFDVSDYYIVADTNDYINRYMKESLL